MPKYLCRDYWQLYAEENRGLLDSCLLVYPALPDEHSRKRAEEWNIPWNNYKLYKVEKENVFNDNTFLTEFPKSKYSSELPIFDKEFAEKSLTCNEELLLDEEACLITNEVFYPDSTYTYERVCSNDNTARSALYDYLEDMESFDQISCCTDECDYYPTVWNIVSRLKKRTVADPLLNSKGELLIEEDEFLKDDKIFVTEFTQLKVYTGSGDYKEQFNAEAIDKKESIYSLEEPFIDSHCYESECLLTYIINLIFKENMNKIEDITTDHQEALNEFSLTNNIKETRKLIKNNEFKLYSLLDQNVKLSTPSNFYQEEELIKLESPITELFNSTTLHPQILFSFKSVLLNGFIKPPKQFLSPKRKSLVESKINQYNQKPNEILLLMLPIPDIVYGLNEIGIEDIFRVMNFHEDSDFGRLDLKLRWDPLLGSYDLIENTTSIICKQPNLSAHWNCKEGQSEYTLLKMISKENNYEEMAKYDRLISSLEKQEIIQNNITHSSNINGYPSSSKNSDYQTAICYKNNKYNNNNFNISRNENNDNNKNNNNNSSSSNSSNSQSLQNDVVKMHTDLSVSNSNINNPRVDKNQSKRNRSANSVVQSKSGNNDSDEFQIMRSDKIKKKGTNSPTTSKIGKREFQSSMLNEINKRICTKDSPKIDASTGKQFEIIKVPLNETYRCGINLMMANCEPLLEEINAEGLLSNYSVNNLVEEPQIVQSVIVKIQKKCTELDVSNNIGIWNMLRALSHLYCLIYSCFALLNTSLEVAIEALFNTVRKYKTFLHDSHIRVGKQLLAIKESSETSFHPKILEVIRLLKQEYNNSYPVYSSIIIFETECDDYTSISEVHNILLSQIEYLTIDIIEPLNEDNDNYYAEILRKNITSGKCYLCFSSTITYKHFPINYFKLFVLYNHSESSETVRQLLLRANELSVKIILLKTELEILLTTENKEAIILDSDIPKYVICSTKLTQVQGLLELIEMRCNMRVIERNYEKIPGSIIFADLTISERAGIIMLNMTEENAPDKSGLMRMCNSLQIKYSKCYVLAYTAYPELYSGNVPKYLAEVNQIIRDFKSNNCQFELNGSTDLEGVARVIDTIIMNERNNERESLMPELEMTESEQKLLSFKSINSCTAQIMSSQKSIRDLFTMDLNELCEAFITIPTHCLKTFWETCQQLQSSNKKNNNVTNYRNNKYNNNNFDNIYSNRVHPESFRTQLMKSSSVERMVQMRPRVSTISEVHNNYARGLIGINNNNNNNNNNNINNNNNNNKSSNNNNNNNNNNNMESINSYTSDRCSIENNLGRKLERKYEFSANISRNLSFQENNYQSEKRLNFLLEEFRYKKY